MARHLASLGREVEYAYVPEPRRPFARKKTAEARVDPLLSRQWGHTAVRIGQARERAGFKEATAITVAVADTGIDRSHPDLKKVISEYKNFLKGEGDRDYSGHGTHVAGIIAAEMNNGVGVSGLCGAKLLALKVLPSRVEWDAAAYYRALAYCIGRARVLNLSLGSAAFDPGERDVIADLIDEGIVVVAAMGNEFEHGNPVEYPAALPGVCAVGATDHADRRGSFSNTGKHIALSAPGVSIVSTTPTYRFDHGKRDYDTWDGTSMAAPHVAAAAALLLAKKPDLTPAQVIQKLQRSADKVPGMKKRPNNELGWGRLNIEKALAKA
jgi:subtilisin family serine protease